MDKEVAAQLNEGLGGAYERIAYSNRIIDLARRYGCKSILELNATFIAGIPGFNSCLLAQAGYDVTITVNSRDYEDALKVWELTGLKANIVKLDGDEISPFADNSFDFVYNHLAFEHKKQPVLLVKEMRRISRMLVMNLTLSPYNLGFMIHRVNHLIQGKPYDHGYARQSTIKAMVKAHEAVGLKVVETGACDAPPWQDTVDAQMSGSMTYMDNTPLKNKWIWTSVNQECQNSALVKFLWGMEEDMPDWFRIVVAHHLYCASLK